MLLVEVVIADEKSYWQLVRIVQGEEVHTHGKTNDGRVLAQVLMTEQQQAEATRSGYECRVVKDYAKLPDPRDEVSKTNRFEQDLRRLRGERGGG